MTAGLLRNSAGAAFVGLDPAGLCKLADVADQYAVRLAAAEAVITPLLATTPTAQRDVAGVLRSAWSALDDRAGELRRRARAIARSTETAGANSFLTDQRFGEVAAVGVLSPRTGCSDLLGWVECRWLDELRDRTPEQVAAAFAALDSDRGLELARAHPEMVGRLDGAPPRLRYTANRALILSEIAELEVAADTLRHEAHPDSPAVLVLRSIEERAERYRGWLVGGRQILLFDPAGDGRVVEVFGSLESAEWVGVLVPGMANDIDNFSSVSGGFRADAANLLAASDRGDTATIAWLGYDTPDGIDAAGRGAAEAAAPSLASFLRGIDPDRERTITVFAHSYGSVVAGVAAASALEADNLVFLGSPGTTLDHAGCASLRDGARVWAALASGDPIGLGIDPGSSLRWRHVLNPMSSLLALTRSLLHRDDLWHGTNPADSRFGAVRIATTGSSGHSQYYEAATVDNLALILTGRYDEVIREG